mmetsp:Transcript_15973/g.23816  ORF Transcript_15973/g.23816 Transcript_15973/m.23816 type:complete len:586 (-) Transcript_15973:156-1913(-)
MSNKFPLKLMGILDTCEHPDIIGWLPHGRGFVIRDKRRLADIVLPKYFKESKYTSFSRRLNRWNFTIQTHGHKEASYFHPLFIQGDPQRALEMHPTPQSSNSKRETRYFDQNTRMALGIAPEAPMMDGLPALPGMMGQSNEVQRSYGHPHETGMEHMNADQGQGRGHGSGSGGPDQDSSYSGSPGGNNTMPSHPRQQQGSVNMDYPGANFLPGQSQMPQMQSFQMNQMNHMNNSQPMQVQFYGHGRQHHSMQGSMNPMYGSQTHHRENMTRDMIYSHQGDMYPQQQFHQMQGMGGPGPGMVAIVQHPQMQSQMAQQQPPQMGMPQPQYGDLSQPQYRDYVSQQTHYIPTTSASRPHVQVMYAGGEHVQMPPHMQERTMQEQSSRHSYARNSMGSQFRDMNPSGGMQSQYQFQHSNMPSGSSSGMNNAHVAAERKPKGMVPVTTMSPSPTPRASSLAPSKRLLKKAKETPKIDTEKATSPSVDQEDAEESAVGTSARKEKGTPSSSPRGTDDSLSPSEKRTIIYSAGSINVSKFPSEGIDSDVSPALAVTTDSSFLAPECITQTKVMRPVYPARISPATVQKRSLG